METVKGRWIGIDYGNARIGVAVSDPTGMLARRLETINWNGRDMEWAMLRIVDLIREHQAIGLVIGLPRRTDGQSGESESRARQFADELANRTGLAPILSDERFTTVLASRVMRETGVRPDRRKKVIDQIAAEIILQEYLDKRRKGAV